MCVFSLFYLTVFTPSFVMAAEKAIPGSMAEKVPKPNAAFDADKMGDMSDYNPAKAVSPTGDTIKIAVVASFSGPAAANGEFYWNIAHWVAHDYNKRGGIWVDGKKKLIQVIKADHQSKPDVCRKICERMALQEKVHVFMGTDGSHMMKIINEVANRYKVIAFNFTCLSDDIQDATNFGRYSFQAAFSTEQVGRAFAYFYGQIRKKEKKFYILCQDYSFGREIAAGFKTGLKEYYPEAELVGEDYHKLFLTDFAPYMEKIKASGAEVIFSGDWYPDAGTLLKQARQMGIMLPVANVYMDTPNFLHEIGAEGTKGLQNLNTFAVENPQFREPGYAKIYKTWNDLWKNKWTPPYNSVTYEVYGGSWGTWSNTTYWLMSVIERAKSTDPEKIIKIWEGDTFRYVNGKIVKMRACDHKIIHDLAITEFVPWEGQKVSYNIPPYYWYKNTSNVGPVTIVPAAKILPWMDPKLDRCKGKNSWGE
jgi:ABC-type branched-subunit amino acid transport system substrate-binding protein